MMEAVRNSETSVNFNVTTRCYIPEDSELHTRCRENLKSHIGYCDLKNSTFTCRTLRRRPTDHTAAVCNSDPHEQGTLRHQLQCTTAHLLSLLLLSYVGAAFSSSSLSSSSRPIHLVVSSSVRFQVLTAASMMFRIVFWDVLPCKTIVDRRFRGAYCLHHP
jgi:hypothetical protein